VSVIVCVLVLELSAIVTAPLTVPAVDGSKSTIMLQFAPAARDEPHELLCSKLALTAMLLMLRATFPVFVRVTVCEALVVPTVWLPKVRLVADRLSVGVALAPVPVRLTVWALVLALSLIDNDPVTVPVVVGAKATEIVQFAPAARDEPQVLVCEKPLLAAMPLMLRATFPVFLRVTV